MTRLFSLIIVIIMMIPILSACVKVEETEKTEEQTEIISESKKAEDISWKGISISPEYVLTPEKLYSFPIASSDMTEDEIRNLVLDFMTLQNNVPWIAGNDYYSNWNRNDRHFKKNTLFLGMPYGFHSGSLYTFVDHIDPSNGVLFDSKLIDFEHYMVNDCSDGFFWAWARISPSITFTTPVDMMEKNGVLKVGDYKWPQEGIKNLDDFNTFKVRDLNGENVMYEAYAKVKRADGFLNYRMTPDDATDVSQYQHVMMVKDIYVVRDSKGKIDPEKSYVTIMEQGNWTYVTKLDGHKAYDLSTEGDGSNNKRTFAKLYHEAYLPITCAELKDKSKIEEPYIKLTGIESGNTYSMEEVLNGVVESNYRFANLKITLYNEDGTVLKERPYCGNNSNGTEKNMRQINLSEAFVGFSVPKSGKFRATVETTIGCGIREITFDGFVQK